MLDPVANSEKTTQEPLSPRPDKLDDQRIGLCTNGKKAAEPTLRTVEKRLADRHPSLKFGYYQVSELNLLKNDSEITALQKWAREETDACFTAIGDCGSCTKFLTWMIDAIEATETPAVGLLAEGFELDWVSNARDLAYPIRHVELPVRPERVDTGEIREALTEEVVREIEAELVRPRTERERGRNARPEP